MEKTLYHIPIRISGLSDGQHSYKMSVEPTLLDLSDEFDTELSIQVDLEKTHAQFILNINIDSSAVFPCDRCLEPVRIGVLHNAMLFYTFDPTSARSLDDDNVHLLEPDEPIIDIGGDVRDYVLLAVPMKKTCGEDTDGNPLCTVSTDRSRFELEGEIDPRWAKLKDL